MKPLLLILILSVVFLGHTQATSLRDRLGLTPKEGASLNEKETPPALLQRTEQRGEGNEGSQKKGSTSSSTQGDANGDGGDEVDESKGYETEFVLVKNPMDHAASVYNNIPLFTQQSHVNPFHPSIMNVVQKHGLGYTDYLQGLGVGSNVNPFPKTLSPDPNHVFVTVATPTGQAPVTSGQLGGYFGGGNFAIPLHPTPAAQNPLFSSFLEVGERQEAAKMAIPKVVQSQVTGLRRPIEAGYGSDFASELLFVDAIHKHFTAEDQQDVYTHLELGE